MREGDTSTVLSVEDQRRLAVLIDADNAQPSVIEGLLAEVAKFGVAGVKRIYGDWTSTKHGQWKLCLLEHSITPIQQFAYTSGKNATDSSLIIDAMDLMYSKHLDGFCLVSSDSDFTRLAQRLREAGLVVYGFGEQKTPKPFVVACDKFIYTEVLRKDSPSGPAGSGEHADLVRAGTDCRPWSRRPTGGQIRPSWLRRRCPNLWGPQSASFCRQLSKGRTSPGGPFWVLSVTISPRFSPISILDFTGVASLVT